MNNQTSREPANMFRFVLPVVLIFSLYLVYLVAQPFLHTIIMGIVFAALCAPIQKRTLALFKNRSLPASLLTMLIILVGIFFPIVLFAVQLVPQAVTSVGKLSTWLSEQDIEMFLKSPAVTGAFDTLKAHLPFISIEPDSIKTSLLDAAKTVSQFVLQRITGVVANTLSGALHFALLLLVMFFLLLDGKKMSERFMYLLPLKEVQKDAIIKRLKNVARAVLVGGLLVAALQGVVGGIALGIAGFPVFFCIALMFTASLVPVIGTGLVWIPVTIWLFATGQVKMGVFVLLWCGILVTTIDSVLRPLFVRSGAGLSTIGLFLSILGGLQVFGMLGLFYGPLILGFAVVMLSLYAREYETFLNSRWHSNSQI